MAEVDRATWQLTPSQKSLRDAIQSRLASIQGRHRPFLLTGDLGVGKSYLSRRLAVEGADFHHLAQDHLPGILGGRALLDLTPEATVRYVKQLADVITEPYIIVDGLEPLVSLWAVERPRVLGNLFVALNRAILERPLLIVMQTSDHLPKDQISKGSWWPCERRFRLELTLADKEVVAQNWGLDPLRARMADNLYDLLADRLGR